MISVFLASEAFSFWVFYNLFSATLWVLFVFFFSAIYFLSTFCPEIFFWRNTELNLFALLSSLLRVRSFPLRWLPVCMQLRGPFPIFLFSDRVFFFGFLESVKPFCFFAAGKLEDQAHLFRVDVLI